MAANARHSKKNRNWQTPSSEIACARNALGGHIDLDPFSCISANERVCARDWYGLDNPSLLKRDGFSALWRAETVFVNHPGLTTKKSWTKLLLEWKYGHFERLIWVGFSVEQICILAEPTAYDFVPTDFAICYLRERIHFIDDNDPDAEDRPAHANYILAVGVERSDFETAYAGRGTFTYGSQV